MRLYIALLFVLMGTLVSGQALARTTQNQNQHTQAAQQIFNELAKTTLMRANFQQKKQLPNTNKTFVSSGKVVFAKNQGVLWQISSPVKADLIMTAKNMVQKTANTQSRISLEQNQHASTATVFLGLMSGDSKTLNDNFSIKSAKYTAQSWQIALSPKSATMKKLFNDIQIDGGKNINKIIIKDKSQGTTTITFSGHQHSTGTLSDSENALFKLAN
jgi:hypothetical protein